MPDKLRIAQVGVGNFGAYRRARLRETGLFELAAVYDHNPAAMAAAAKEDGAHPCASFEELLATPGIEGLVVSTGGKYHAEQAIAAMQRGLHVFVEKPLCSTPEEMHAMLAAQRAAGVVVGVGHNDHTNEPFSRQLKELIAAGELGRVAAVEATTAHSGGLVMKPGEWRSDPKKNPGGMLFQCGCHSIHELHYLFGPIVRVQAMMRYDVHTTATADVALCHLQFASGLVAALQAYHVTPYRHTLFVFGTKMSVYSINQYGPVGLQIETQALGVGGQYEPRVPLAITGPQDICGNVKSWYRCIRDGGTPYPSLADGARAVAVVFACEESTRLGKAIDVADIG